MVSFDIKRTKIPTIFLKCVNVICLLFSQNIKIFLKFFKPVLNILLFQRQIEKSNDLFEECKQIKDSKGQHLKELSSNLKIQMKAFKEKLEDAREKIEDTSRCFTLLQSCQDILEDDCKEQEEFIRLAQKSGNEKLIETCQVRDFHSLLTNSYKIFNSLISLHLYEHYGVYKLCNNGSTVQENVSLLMKDVNNITEFCDFEINMPILF